MGHLLATSVELSEMAMERERETPKLPYIGNGEFPDFYSSQISIVLYIVPRFLYIFSFPSATCGYRRVSPVGSLPNGPNYAQRLSKPHGWIQMVKY